jgi:amino acid adenylation domain-containing protein
MTEMRNKIKNLSPEEKRDLLAKLLKKAAESTDTFPLSYSQERLWFLEQLEQLGAAYNLWLCLKIKGPLQVEALRRSFNEIVRRHRVLRTTFSLEEGEPVQVVGDSLSVPLPLEDLRKFPQNERLDRARESALRETESPFDLAQGPLLRVKLYRLERQEYILLVTMHHIVSDRWSMDIFIREMAVLYDALTKGDPSPLPELPQQYTDFALWQRRWLRGEVLESQLNFWKKEMADPPILDLPTDYTRPPFQTFRGSTYAFPLENPLKQRLREISRETGTTMFMVLLASFSILMSWYSGKKDIVIGTPIANRKRREFESLIGFFLNTLLLRVDLGGRPSFLELLSRVRQVALSAYAHQDIPFERLVEALRPERDLSRNPLFQVMFIFQKAESSLTEVTGLSIIPMEVERLTAKFDLQLSLTETPRGFTGVFEYNADLFAQETIGAAAHRYRALLEQLAAAPARPIGQISMVTAAEGRLLTEWNDTAVDYPLHQHVHRLMEEQADREPDRLALVGLDLLSSSEAAAFPVSLSYGECNRRAGQWAAALQERGLDPGAVAALLVEPSLQMLMALLGILKAGGAYLPMDVDCPSERIRYMLEDSRAGFLITTRSLEATGSMVIPLSSGVHNHPPLLKGMCGRGDELAYITYTSGSTGRPKGVMIRHRSVVNFIEGMGRRIDFGAGKTILALTTISFDIFVTEALLPLCRGMKVVIADRRMQAEPGQLRQAIDRSGIDMLQVTPSRLHMMTIDEEGIAALAGVRELMVGGEAFPENLWARLRQGFDGKIYNLYGPTETTVWSTLKELNEAEKMTIGTPIANTRIYIAAADGGLLPPGLPGELCIGDDGLSPGYLNRPELTAEKFVNFHLAAKTHEDTRSPTHQSLNPKSQPLYRTGDLCRFLPGGDIEFLGRIDHQVKLRGFRVELGEIESRLLQHPSIREAAVVSRQDSVGDRYLAAYIVPTTNRTSQTSPAKLRQYLAEILPHYMIPSFFIRLDRLPLTPNGKLDRRALPPPEGHAATRHEPPQDETESRLAAIWAEVLAVDRETIGRESHFFSLGGHSLKAMILISRMAREFEVEFPLKQVFSTPQLRQFAHFIRNVTRRLREEIRPQERRDYYPQSPSQQRLFLLDQFEEIGTSYHMPLVLQVDGAFDTRRCEAVFRALVDRHETLRTSFRLIQGKPQQIVHDDVIFNIEYFNVTGKKPGSRELDTLIRTFIRPFDLARAPLLRVGIVPPSSGDAPGEGKFVLMVDIHHIVTDGTSMNILVQEFLSLWAGEELPRLNIQYKDYALWQQGRRQDQAMENRKRYWLDRFADAIPVLDLPTDAPRPAVQDFSGKTVHRVLDSRLTAGLRDLSTDQEVTLYMVLLSIFSVLLSRLSGVEDMVVGTPAAGRPHADLQLLVGMFVNTLTLRSWPKGVKGFAAFLQEIKKVVLEAVESQDYPFEELVEHLDVRRDTGRNPLFDVMFVFQVQDAVRGSAKDITITSYEIENRTSRFDLSLIVAEGGDILRLSIEYRSQLFNRQSIERYFTYFERIASVVIGQPGVRIGEIEMVSAEEKSKILYQLNDTAAAYPADRTIHGLFEDQVRQSPHRLALECNGSMLSYGELDRRACRLAGYLQHEGVNPADMIGLLAGRSLVAVFAILGILKAGCAYLPIDPDYPQERQQFMLADSGARVLLDDHLLGQINESIAESDVFTQPARLEPTNLAYVLYTSGTTGRPKGVMVNHRSVVRLVKQSNYITLGPHTRLLQTGPLTFDASTFEIWGPLLNGGVLHIMPPHLLLVAQSLKDKLLASCINTLWMTAPLFNQMVDVDIELFSRLRCLLVGGDRLSPAHINRLRRRCSQLAIINGYGPTENTTFSTTFTIDREYEGRIPIGRPIANSTAYIVDRHRHILPPGIAGELWVGGDGLSRGYLNNPDLTAEKFKNVAAKGREDTRSPNYYILTPKSQILYRTGDLARFLPDGTIDFLGRLDDQVKIRGFRIEPAEIERRLLQHGGIETAVVVADEDERREKYLTAYIVPTTSRTSPAQLRQYLSRTLPEYMIPAYFVLLKEMPLTARGKIDRRGLPAPTFDTAEDRLAPENDIQERLLKIWSDVLGVERRYIGIDDDFFALGGHSLKAVAMTVRIQEELAVKVPLGKFFGMPTIKNLSGIIAEEDRGLPFPLRPLERREYYGLSNGQERLWALSQVPEASLTFNMTGAYVVAGKFRKEIFEAVLRHLVERHESLRTAFVTVDGEPRQKILPAGQVAFPLEEACGCEGVSGEQRVRQAAAAEGTVPIDLSTPPLCRGKLILLGEEKCGLVFTMHHIISDALSMGVLFREVALFYTAFSAHSKPPIKPLKVQYKDYAAWQREWLTSKAAAIDREYWLDQLRGPLPVLELPTDRQRPALKTYRGAVVRRQLDRHLTEQLRTLARQNEATLFMVLHSVLNVWLFRYTGQTDMVTGTPIAGREQADLTDQIGFYLNTLPLRVRFQEGDSFLSLLHEVKRVTLDAHTHQAFPFDRLVEALAIGRDVGRNPLFDVVVDMLNLNVLDRKWPEEFPSFIPLMFDHQMAKFDLTVYIAEGENIITLSFEYNTDLFDGRTIERLAARLEALARQIVTDPHANICDLAAGASRVSSIRAKGERLSLVEASYHQERLWFIDRFETGNVYDSHPIYHNIPLILEIEGTLDTGLLEQGIRDAAGRHEALRTRIVTVEELPVQFIEPAVTIELERLNGKEGKPGQSEASPVEAVLAFARRPLPLNGPHLVRAGWLSLSKRRHLLILVVHHIVADRPSLTIFCRELFAFYRAYAAGKEPALPAVSLQYADFSRWQRGFSDDLVESMLFYWRRRLKGGVAALELPTDRPRQPVQVFREGRHTFQISPPLFTEVENAARQWGIPQSTILMAAFTVLLHQYSRQQEIVIGTTIANRDEPGTEEMIGPVANLLVVQSTIDPSARFLEILRDLQQEMDESVKYRALPFDRLALAINPAKDMSRTVFFDVLFQYEEDTPVVTAIPGVESVKIVETNLGLGKYDLNLLLQRETETFSASLVYNREYFNDATAVRLGRHYLNLLEQLLTRMHQPLCRISMVSEEERQDLLSRFNDTAVLYPADQTIHRLFEAQAAKVPDHVTLVDLSDQMSALTYRHLDQTSGRLARRLRASGVGSNTITALMMGRSLKPIIVILGILKSGSAYLPIDPDYPQERRQFMLADSGARTLLDDHSVDRLNRPGGKGRAFTRPTQLKPTSLAYVIYTSGTTGRPKGSLIEHRNVVRLLVNNRFPFDFNHRDVWTLFHSLCFDFSVWEMYGALLYGGRLIVIPRMTARSTPAFLQVLDREQVTVLNQTPPAFYNLMDEESNRRDGERLVLRYVIFGGDVLHPGRLKVWRQRYPDTTLVNMYGITETTVHVTFKEITEGEIERNISSIGAPIPTLTADVMTAEGQLLPVGIPGELWVGGEGVCRGYLNRVELSSERFIPHPYRPGERVYRSGDRVRRHEDGEMEYLGRLDSQVKIRGFRIELAEIEHQLLQHRDIREAVVTVREDEGGERYLAAYIVPQTNRTSETSRTSQTNETNKTSPAKFRNYLAGILPDYMIPAHFVPLAKIPLTANGKVDHSALPAPQIKPTGEFVPPENVIEKQVAAIWAEVLKVDPGVVGREANFFEIGGDSLKITRVMGKIKEVFNRDIPLVSLFEHPTIAAFSLYLSQQRGEDVKSVYAEPVQGAAPAPQEEAGAVAVIGMACRFPGAADIHEFWRNLKQGVESIVSFSEEELLGSGVSPDLPKNPDYVKAYGILENKDLFDASFFGYTPTEADIMDPQMRIFHECAWEALEDAGYDPDAYDGLIGVYAGGGHGFNWEVRYKLSRKSADFDDWTADKYINVEFLSSRVSYNLNLRGPAVYVQTACSTSLVAIHLACRGLAQRECHLALAGGVDVSPASTGGYLYRQGMIMSADGHCRAFDDRAGGIVPGEGAGLVVLRPLAEALEAGDTVRAVIKGSAVNNDGKRKVGFTAPGVGGQRAVIRAALRSADVPPESIGYVETHGTGTIMGDPVEIEALTQAFGTDKRGFCAVGSVKANVGHLGSAAGVVGFIKAVLILAHGGLPPSLHYQASNRDIDFAASPFYVNTGYKPWPRRGHPRRAGVSSFGIGGTNAHIVLEEAADGDSPQEGMDGRGADQLIVWSVRSEAALEKMTKNLADYFKNHPDVNPADAAYTLQVGRRAFGYRQMLVCSSLADAVDSLSFPGSGKIKQGSAGKGEKKVVFMFPGQGAQYVNMARDLYETEPFFRRQMDRCFEILGTLMADDLKDIWLPGANQDVGDADLRPLDQTELAQPALFVVEYALAQLLMKWGIRPEAMIGHSIGEYTAAHLAGVFSLEDALELVVRRGQLMQSVPGGAMLSVPLPEDELSPLLNEELSLAAVNAPHRSVVSGTAGAIDAFAAEMEQRGIDVRRLHTSHAFHSPLMEPVIPQFERRVAELKLSAPQIPYISNVSGTWITGQEARDPAYYARHLRQTVRFSRGIETLLARQNVLLVEVGPGQMLSTLARQHQDRATAPPPVNLIRHPGQAGSDLYFLLEGIGRLWLHGAAVDWREFHGDRRRRRIPLPTYPFQRRRFGLQDNLSQLAKMAVEGAAVLKPEKRLEVGDWFYMPSWRRLDLTEKPAVSPPSCNWLLFADEEGVADQLVERLRQDAQEGSITVVRAGTQFERLDDHRFIIDPRNPEGYETLFGHIETTGPQPDRVVHLWGVTGRDDRFSGLEGVDEALDYGFYSLLYLARALGNRRVGDRRECELVVIADHMHEVTGVEPLQPLKATMLGAVRVIAKEYPGLNCRSIDVDLVEGNRARQSQSIGRLILELTNGSPEPIAAWRGSHRWVQSFEPLPLAPSTPPFRRLRQQGVYLITGGFGGIGFVLARYLAQTFRARLVLVGRQARPEREKSRIRELEKAGAAVLACAADVADLGRMREVLTLARQRFGRIHGVIHSAGLADYGGVIHRRTREQSDAVLAAKVRGSLVLDTLLAEAAEAPDFVLLCSSISSVLAPFGQVAYVAANAFLDAFALAKNREAEPFTVAVDWDAWGEVGMAVAAHFRPLDHPLFDGRGSGETGEERLVSHLRVDTHWLLDEHRILGTATLPGTAYLEMVRAAVELVDGAAALEMRDFYILRPLRVEENEEKEVHTILQKGETDGGFTVSIVSRQSVGQDTWQEHARCQVATVPEEPAAPVGIEEIEAACDEMEKRFAAGDQQVGGEFLTVGPRWQNFKQVKIGGNQGLARLELPSAFAADLRDYRMHPALMDSATAFLLMKFQDARQYLPFYFRKVRFTAPLPSRVCSHATCVAAEGGRRNSLSFNIAVMDEAGSKLVDVEGFTLLEISQEQQPESPPLPGGNRGQESKMIKNAIDSREGVDVVLRVLSASHPQVLVSTTDLSVRLQQSRAFDLSELPGDSPEGADSSRSVPRGELSTSYVAPRSRTEQNLAQLWQGFFGIDKVGIFDDFFELGGDSLKAVNVLTRIHKELEVELQLTDLFNTPFIEGMARAIDGLSSQDKYSAIEPVESREFYPMSSAQRRLYFLQQMQKENIFYNIPQIVKLEGQLDRQRVEEAFRVLLRRHESLRTSFCMVSGEAVQVVHRPEEVDSRVRYREIPEDEVEQAVRQSVRPFDLTEAPLLRVTIFCTGGQAYIWLFDIHHIVTDATGHAILLKDLFKLYQRQPLPPVRLQYKDFSLWQNQLLLKGELKRQEEYWLKRFADVDRLPRLKLPYDHVRPRSSRFAGSNYVFQVDGDTKVKFMELGTGAGVTFFMNILAVFAVLLYKYTGQRDMVIGSSIAGRPHADLQEILGMFVNLLPLRLRPGEQVGYREFLLEVKQVSLEAFENQDMQFEMLVEKLRLESDLFRNPLFDVCINVQNYEQPEYQSGDLKVTPYKGYQTDTSKFDMLLWVNDLGSEIRFILEYSTELFKRTTIEKFCRRLVEVIGQVVENGDIPLEEIQVSHGLSGSTVNMPSLDFKF